MHDALSTTLNIVHNDSISSPDSPAVDSVATPINNTLIPDIKIAADYPDQEQESDARHEPVPLKFEKLDNASIIPQMGSPVDPSTFWRLLTRRRGLTLHRFHPHRPSLWNTRPSSPRRAP